MVTLIDALVIELGFDTTGFTKGQKDAAASFIKTKENAEKSAKDIEAANKKVGESYQKLAGLAIEFFAVLAAGKGLKEFVSDIQRTDLAIGRLAMTTGTAVKSISTWGNAVQEAGYNADDALSSIASLQNKIQDFVSFGKGGEDWVPIFAKFGIAAKDSAGQARDALDMFRDLNAAFNNLGMGTTERESWTRRLGLDAGTRALLDLSTDEFNKRVAKASTDAISDKSTEAARKLAEQIGSLQIKTKALGTALVADLEPVVGKIVDDMSDWIDKNKDWIEQDFAGATKVLGDNVNGVELAFAALITLLTGSAFLKALAGVRMLAGALGGTAGSGGPIGWIIKGGLALSAAATGMVASNPDAFKGGKDDFALGANIMHPDAAAPADGGPIAWLWNAITGKKDKGITHNGQPVSKSNPLPVQDVSINDLHDRKWPLESQDKGFWGNLWSGITGAFSGSTSSGATPPAHAGGAAPTMPGGRFHSPGSDATNSAPPLSSPSNSRRGQIVAGTSDAWRAAGMSEAGVAGVLGNIEQESNFDPNLHHPDNPRIAGDAGYSHGLYQENGDEWARYQSWLSANHPGTAWQDPAAQSEFAAWNLKTNYPRVWAAMKAAKTPEEAALIYRKGYLKPAEWAANDAHRMGAAGRFYQHPVTSKGTTTDDGLSGLRGNGLFGSDAAAAVARASQRAPLPTDLIVGARGAAMSAAASNSNVSNSSETHIGEINVHTQATDARGIATDMKPAMQGIFDAAPANYGIA